MIPDRVVISTPRLIGNPRVVVDYYVYVVYLFPALLALVVLFGREPDYLEGKPRCC